VTEPTRKLFLETDGDCREVIEIGDDDESRELMLQLGWVRAEHATELLTAIAKDGQDNLNAAVSAMSNALKAEMAMNGSSGHQIPDLETASKRDEPLTYENHAPRTMVELHELLTRLVANGYASTYLLNPEAELHIAGREWLVGANQFIEAVSWASQLRHSIHIGLLWDEFEKQTRYKVEPAAGKLPSERIGERYEERLAILARANAGAIITLHEQVTAHMLAIEDVLNERLGPA
jgi:hypothetical protein